MEMGDYQDERAVCPIAPTLNCLFEKRDLNFYCALVKSFPSKTLAHQYSGFIYRSFFVELFAILSK